jgi:hypothetical protein
MTELRQEPALLDVWVAIDDDWSYLLDFDIVLTGYTFAGNVVSGLTSALTAITIATTDLAAGKITVSLTDTQITALGLGTHKWYITWTVSGLSRRVLAGNFKVEQYP